MSNAILDQIEATQATMAESPYWMHYSAARPGTQPKLGDLVAIGFQSDGRSAACVYRIVALHFDALDNIKLDAVRQSDNHRRTDVPFEAVSLLRR